MHRYFIKTPWIVKKLFPSYVWSIPGGERAVYLTFDDGPHPAITPFVLQQLKQYKALATFFCIGKNVADHPDVYGKILEQGHAVGNHTYNHVNGWKMPAEAYIENVLKAATYIHSPLFRPPYGKIRSKQAKKIKIALGASSKIIMWDVLSADFDASYSPQQCLNNVLKNVSPGSVIVFHDSEKAFKNLQYVLPVVLKELADTGYIFRKIEF